MFLSLAGWLGAPAGAFPPRAPQHAQRGENLEVAFSVTVCYSEGMTTHIRKPPGRSTGNQWYKDRRTDTPAHHTICGAEPTDHDQSWSAARFAQNLAYVDCEECTIQRSELGERGQA